jgi:hypothetical protein
MSRKNKNYQIDVVSFSSGHQGGGTDHSALHSGDATSISGGQRSAEGGVGGGYLGRTASGGDAVPGGRLAIIHRDRKGFRNEPIIIHNQLLKKKASFITKGSLARWFATSNYPC